MDDDWFNIKRDRWVKLRLNQLVKLYFLIRKIMATIIKRRIDIFWQANKFAYFIIAWKMSMLYWNIKNSG